MPKPTDGEWLTVRAAAKAAGVPLRSIYRWIKSGKVRCLKENGTKYVDAAAVRRQAATRATLPAGAALPDIAGKVVGNGALADKAAQNGTALATETDGRIAARVFERFDAGASPIDVVRELELPPERVRALHREWTAMKSATPDKAGAKTIEAEVADLRRGLNYLATEVREQDTRSFVNRHDERLERFEELFRSERCPCGGTMYAVIPLACDRCDFRAERPVVPSPRPGY
jgi:hypothetical protein